MENIHVVRTKIVTCTSLIIQHENQLTKNLLHTKSNAVNPCIKPLHQNRMAVT